MPTICKRCCHYYGQQATNGMAKHKICDIEKKKEKKNKTFNNRQLKINLYILFFCPLKFFSNPKSCSKYNKKKDYDKQLKPMADDWNDLDVAK